MKKTACSSIHNLEELRWQVWRVLSHKRQTRNDDKLLYWSLCDEFYWLNKIMTIDDFMALPNYDTITRIRRRYNEQFRYLPTKKSVIRARFKKKQSILTFLWYKPE